MHGDERRRQSQGMGRSVGRRGNVRRAFKGWWATAAVLGCAPAALAGTIIEPRARVSLEERYDDDFRLNTPGQAGGQMMTKVSPRVGLDAKDETLHFESFYATDFLARHGSGELSFDHRGGLKLDKLLTRELKVEAVGAIYRVTDPTSLPRESVARSTQPVLYGTGKLYVSDKVSRQVELGTGYAFEGVRELVPGSTAGFVHTPFVEAWLHTSRRLTLGAEYRYQAFLFGNRMDQAHGIFGALRYRLTRHTTATVRAGPVAYYGQDGTQGYLPRVKLELLHETVPFDLGLIAGHDLVGASGFTTAVWADYAGLTFTERFSQRLSLYGAASFFRNGQAPNVEAFQLTPGTSMSQGYALSAGLEFKLTRNLAMQAAFDRIAQVGMGEVAAGVNLTRNVGAVRFHMTVW